MKSNVDLAILIPKRSYLFAMRQLEGIEVMVWCDVWLWFLSFEWEVGNGVPECWVRNESSEWKFGKWKLPEMFRGGYPPPPPKPHGQTPRVGTLEFGRVGINIYTCYINILVYYYYFYRASVYTFVWSHGRFKTFWLLQYFIVVYVCTNSTKKERGAHTLAFLKIEEK